MVQCDLRVGTARGKLAHGCASTQRDAVLSLARRAAHRRRHVDHRREVRDGDPHGEHGLSGPHGDLDTRGVQRDHRQLGEPPLAGRVVNIKPARIGSLRKLFEVYERWAREQRPMYGGGLGELGVARGQIELLAGLFHADAPNDVAPSVYNLDDPPGPLPPSPLVLHPEATGFRLRSGPDRP